MQKTKPYQLDGVKQISDNKKRTLKRNNNDEKSLNQIIQK